MSGVVATGLAEVEALPLGQRLGESQWITVDQPMINAFAHATGDHQWIHVDVERAASGPFGRTIAHGYLTLSLIPRLLPEVLAFDGFAMTVNYGCEKVRFPAPVPVDSRVRASAQVESITPIGGGVQVAIIVTIEIQGSTKPACVATIVVRQYA